MTTTKKHSTKRAQPQSAATPTKNAPTARTQAGLSAAPQKTKVSLPAKPPKPATATKNLSALDAAAKVLADSKTALTTGQMIEQMAAKGYWTSPGGKTPAATLYSAILRELKAKGAASRFVKAERGKFALKK